MDTWIRPIVIGIIVTVIGTVVAEALIKGAGSKRSLGGGHYPYARSSR